MNVIDDIRIIQGFMDVGPQFYIKRTSRGLVNKVFMLTENDSVLVHFRPRVCDWGAPQLLSWDLHFYNTYWLIWNLRFWLSYWSTPLVATTKIRGKFLFCHACYTLVYFLFFLKGHTCIFIQGFLDLKVQVSFSNMIDLLKCYATRNCA